MGQDHVAPTHRQAKVIYTVNMTTKLKDVLERARTWPEEAQEELAGIALEIEASLESVYHATADELGAVDDADRGGIATEQEVEAAFRTFRRG